MPATGLISEKTVLPAVSNTFNPFWYIHRNGSFFQLYKFPVFDIKNIDDVVRKLPFGSSCTFYRLHNNTTEYFLAGSISLDYSFIKPSFMDLYKDIFKDINHYSYSLNKISSEKLVLINSVFSELNLVQVGGVDNSLYSFLMDIGFNGMYPYLKSDIKSNLSAILSGNKHLACFSLSNLDMLPETSNILNDFQYLQAYTIIKPSKERLNEISTEVLKSQNILKSLANKNQSGKSLNVDTIMLDEESIGSPLDSFYVKVSFIFYSPSLASMGTLLNKIEDVLNFNEVSFYYHTTSAQSEFISNLPGNVDLGDYYNLCNKHYLLTLGRKAFLL